MRHGRFWIKLVTWSLYLGHFFPVPCFVVSPPQGQLYVSSFSELVEVPVANCTNYQSCGECILSRDPYCAWNGGQCVDVRQAPPSKYAFLCTIIYKQLYRWSLKTSTPILCKYKHFKIPLSDIHLCFSTWQQDVDEADTSAICNKIAPSPRFARPSPTRKWTPLLWTVIDLQSSTFNLSLDCRLMMRSFVSNHYYSEFCTR